MVVTQSSGQNTPAQWVTKSLSTRHVHNTISYQTPTFNKRPSMGIALEHVSIVPFEDLANELVLSSDEKELLRQTSQAPL